MGSWESTVKPLHSCQKVPLRPGFPDGQRYPLRTAGGACLGLPPHAGSGLRPARHCAALCGGQGPRRRSAFSRGMFWLPTSTPCESSFRSSCLQSYKLKLTRLPQGPCACRELL